MLFGTWFVGTFPNLALAAGGFRFGSIQVLMWIEAFGRAAVALLAFAMCRRLEPGEGER